MLVTICPLASILTAITPCDLTVAFLLIIYIFSIIDIPVGAREDTLAMLLILQPITLVLTAIQKNLESFALKVASHVLAREHGTILPEERALPLFIPFEVLTLVSRPILQCFHAVSVLLMNINAYLLIEMPITNILGSIHMIVGSLSMGLVF
jgi:hypothetical protein